MQVMLHGVDNLFEGTLVCQCCSMEVSLVGKRYKHHRFPVEIISHAVWLSFRFCFSFRDGEELLLERDIIVTYEAIYK